MSWQNHGLNILINFSDHRIVFASSRRRSRRGGLLCFKNSEGNLPDGFYSKLPTSSRILFNKKNTATALHCTALCTLHGK